MRRVIVVAVALSWLVGHSLQAGGVVTDCTEEALLSAVSGGGVVSFAENCSITLTHPINIPAAGLTISSSNHTVSLSGGGTTPLFNVSGGLTLIGLTLTGGRGAFGGAVYIGSAGSLFATNCVFAGNVAAGTNGTAGLNGTDNPNGVGGGGTDGSAGTSALGGAICNAGTLTLWNCVLSTNSVTAGNGAAGGAGGNGGGTLGQGGNGGAGGAGGVAWGGAVYNSKNFTAHNCTFAANSVIGGAGGAGGASGSGNFPARPGNGGAGGVGSGAGIYNALNMVINGCTFSRNTSVGGTSAAGGTQSNGDGNSGPNGGDALGAGISTVGWGLATNCTFFDDMVIGGNAGNGGPGIGTFGQAGDGGNGGNGLGGALYNLGTFSIINCTVANSAAVGGTNGVAGTGLFAGATGQMGQSWGGGVANRGTFMLMNSLFSTNSPGGNGNGSFVDGTHNLSSDKSIALDSGMTGIDPKLGPLAANGGPTLTMSLLPGSPALDAIGNNSANFPETDQRGVHRPVGSGADIGAFELATFPSILQGPRSQTVAVGGSATFNVSAIGAALHYQWRFNSAAITAATASSYTISNVAATNAGAYDVIVTNTYGAVVSDSAVLSVGPQITSGPTNLEVAALSPATFTVVAAGTAPLTYQWYFNGTNALTGAAASYTVPSATTNDAGAYSVIVNNFGGSVTSGPAILTVDTILVQPVSQTVAVGSNVTFLARAAGSGLTYQWQLNGTDISGAQAPTYTFTAKKSDAGEYRAHIYNSVVSMRTDPATLTVLSPPVITNAPPSSLSVTQGQAVTLSIGATGDALGYQWFFQSAALPGATTTSYSLPSAQLTDAGTYTVMVTNPAAAASASTILRVLVPTTILQASIVSNRFNVVFPTQTNLSYVLQYKNNLTDPAWNGLMNTLGTGTLVTNQDILTNPPGRFYRVQVK